MSEARAQILAGIRTALGRGAPEAAPPPPRGPIPARTAGLDEAGLAALFTEMATRVDATVSPVATWAKVPAAVADYLARHDLPHDLVMAADPMLAACPWADRPALRLRVGLPGDGDPVGVTSAFAGIAETGTLMLASGMGAATSLHLLPDTHIAVLATDRLVGPYEDAWDRLHAAVGPGLPRNVCFITGPSRTADIEQRLQLGAHGPRRLHIVLVGGQ